MKHFYAAFFLAFVLFYTSPATSQELRQSLPKGLTETEKGLISHFQFRNTQLTPPPATPVRVAAEWEEVEYLVLTWQPGFQNVLRQIVAVAVNECKVIITTQNQASVTTYLNSFGIDLTNVIFMNAPWDSIWIRDYAGNTVYA